MAVQGSEPAGAIRSATSERMSSLGEQLERIGFPRPELVPEQLELADVEPRRDTPDGLPFCGTCRGYRWLRHDVPSNDPRFGTLKRCPDCLDLSRSGRIDRLAAAAGLSDEQRLKTFERFKPSKASSAAVRAAAAWSKRPDGILVIHGVPGCGKTHLSLAVANALLARELRVVWWYVPDLVEQAQTLIREDAHHEFLRSLKQEPLLLLDDLGATRATEFRIQDVLEPLFDFRYRNRLPTLVTCIGDPEAIKEHVSESIGRRMQDRTACTVVANTAGQWQG